MKYSNPIRHHSDLISIYDPSTRPLNRDSFWNTSGNFSGSPSRSLQQEALQEALQAALRRLQAALRRPLGDSLRQSGLGTTFGGKCDEFICVFL